MTKSSKRRKDYARAGHIANERAGSRDTFRVARAHRVLAESLPELKLGAGARLADDRRRVLREELPDPVLVSPAVASRREIKPEPVRDQPKLHRPEVCKDRPAPRRGGGNGRAFVPWCNRRS